QALVVMSFYPAVQLTRATSENYFIPVYNGQLLTHRDEAWRPFDQAGLAEVGLVIASQHFLGYLDKCACWAVELVSPEAPGAGYQWLGLRSQMGLIDEEHFLLAGRALQIVQWHLDHRFCGRCGRVTILDESD